MRRIVEFRNGLRLAGHPMHALLVHFPLAFLAAVFPLEASAWLCGWSTCWPLGFWTEVAGLVASVPAALAGLPDLLGLQKDSAAERAGNLHMIVMVSAVTMFGLDALIRGGPGPAAVGPRLFVILGLSFSGSALLALGGWLGGEMVYHHGAGQLKE